MDCSVMKKHPLVLEDMRISRSYTGGTLLNKWKGIPSDTETNMCEEWHMSVIEVQNIDSKPGEGLSLTKLPDGSFASLRDVIAYDPVAFLGKKYVEKVGNTAGMGIRTGDSVVRLSLQAHPRPEDAKRYLNFPRGKSEAWFIVETRDITDGEKPYVRIGFKKGITKSKICEMFYAEDVKGIEESMHKIPIHKGDVILVNSGTPHAMGPNAMFLEVADACDFTFKLERQMPNRPLDDMEMHYGIGFDNMLECIDYTTYTEEEIRAIALKTPSLFEKSNAAEVYKFFGYECTSRFTMYKYVIHGDYAMKSTGLCKAAVAVYGSGTMEATDGYKTEFRQGQGVFFPADFGKITFSGNFTFICSDCEQVK